MKTVVRDAKWRAGRSGLPFNITEHDVPMPTCCPVLGIPLDFGQGRIRDHSPSLDRIVPSLGYVRGNVMVVSDRANRIKNDGTAEEHEAIAAYIRRVTASGGR